MYLIAALKDDSTEYLDKNKTFHRNKEDFHYQFCVQLGYINSSEKGLEEEHSLALLPRQWCHK